MNKVVSEYFKKCYPSFQCYNDTHSFTINATDFESLLYNLNHHIKELSVELGVSPETLLNIASETNNSKSIFNNVFVTLTGWGGVTHRIISTGWRSYLVGSCINNIPTYRALGLTGVRLLGSGMTTFSLSLLGGSFFHLTGMVFAGNETAAGQLLKFMRDVFLLPTAGLERGWNDFFRPVVFNTIGTHSKNGCGTTISIF